MDLLQLLRDWYDNQARADGSDLEFSTSTSAVDKPSASVTASSEARMGTPDDLGDRRGRT